MTALPMTLEDALRHSGYTIDQVVHPAQRITVAGGVIETPEMIVGKLTWRRDVPAELGDDLYLGNIPIFDNAYRPVILSHILDRYRTRRLGYNTPGEWKLAFRRWCNLNMTVPNQRYRSTGVVLPLDDRDETDVTDREQEATHHSLDVASDFPQSLISGSHDYASGANDRRVADNAESGETVRRTGRSVSVMELLDQQRQLYLNVDLEVVEAMEPLFLSALDQGEGDPRAHYRMPYGGVRRLNW